METEPVVPKLVLKAVAIEEALEVTYTGTTPLYVHLHTPTPDGEGWRHLNSRVVSATNPWTFPCTGRVRVTAAGHTEVVVDVPEAEFTLGGVFDAVAVGGPAGSGGC